MKQLLFSMIAATMISTAAQAQEIANRRENQQDRIAQGVASGQLTARETARTASAGDTFPLASAPRSNAGRIS